MGRRTLLLIASILVAALGTALVWLYVQGADTRAQQGADLVPVLFLNGSAQAGDDATKLALISRRVPADVAAGAVRSPAELAGQRLTTPAVPGQILLTRMLSTNQTGRFPKGGAVAISISEPDRVPADLRNGDVVDVYALGQRGAVLVAPCVTVRSVGPLPTSQAGAAPAGGTQAVPATIVGFDATPEIAAKLYAIVNQRPALYDHDPKLGC